MSDLACKTCRFFVRYVAEDVKAGSCHRFPPQLYVSEDGNGTFESAAFPEVKESDWCGEHRER